MTLPDGARLVTRIWRPAPEGRYPVLLMRQPYGREIASTVTLAHPSWYAERGYIIAVQDVRGTGGSDGSFDPFASETADGAAAVDWARKLPGGNGQLGLYGFSYQGMTQHLALAGGAQADAIAPVMAAWDLWEDFASLGGAFRLDWGLSWAMQLGANAARRADDGTGFAEFTSAAASLPLTGPEPALPDIAVRRRAQTHLASWVKEIGNASYWAERSPARVALDTPRALSTPALHVGGWFDPFLEGTCKAHAAFAAAGARTRLVIGPWAHIPWQGGGLSVDGLVADWFDRVLKGARNGAEDGPPLSLWDLTHERWRGFDTWPGQRGRFWLSGDGLAASGSTGTLSTEAPRGPSQETFVHDPWRPVPARGHHLASPVGMAERGDLDARADVAVFTTAPLKAPLSIVGDATLDVPVSTDAASFDLHAVLSVVSEDGASRTMTLGHLRSPRSSGQHRLRLRPVCATLDPGARLRLSLSGAAWPAVAVNPGTGESPETTPAHLCRPITITLHTPATLSLGVAA